MLKRSRGLRISASVFLALVVTGVTFVLSKKAQVKFEMDRALSLARQIRHQVEGLTLEARMAGTADPRAWAVKVLSQGQDNRIIRVKKVTSALKVLEESYKTSYDSEKFVYTYGGVSPGDGVYEVEIDFPRVRFLGMKSTWTEDLMLFLFFGINLFFAYINLRRLDPEKKESHTVLRIWFEDSKELLKQFGIKVRDAVKISLTVQNTMSQAFGWVSQLRNRVHSGLSGLVSSRRQIQDLESTCTRLEILFLNIMTEIENPKVQAEQTLSKISEAHQLLLRIRDLQTDAQNSIRGIEKQLEPWTVDLDLAYGALSELQKNSRGLADSTKLVAESAVQSLGQYKEFPGVNASSKKII